MEKTNQITEASIKKLVDDFYVKIRSDEQLGPIFVQAIGESLEAWKPHLEKMYAFWGSLMLGSRQYKGNPFQKHLDLPPFDKSLFDRWLGLFEQTAREIHTDEIADLYVQRSKNIASSLKMGLYPTMR